MVNVFVVESIKDADVSIECPEAIEIGMFVSCTLEISKGNQITATVRVEDHVDKKSSTPEKVNLPGWFGLT